MRMKKSLALLCALMILLTTFSALAESPDELVNKAYENGRNITTVLTIDPPTYAFINKLPSYFKQDIIILKDLLSDLTVQATAQKTDDSTSGTIAVSFSDQEALSFGGTINNENVYFTSSLSGDQLLHVTPTDLYGLFMRMLAASASKDSDFSPEGNQMMLATIEAPLNFMAAIGEFDMEAALQQSRDSYAKYLSMDAIIAYGANLTNPMEITHGTFEGNDHDPAVTKMEFAITGDELANLYMKFVQLLRNDPLFMDLIMQLYEPILASANMPITVDALIETVFAQMAIMVKTAYASYADVPYTILFDENGTPVSIQYTATIQSEKNLGMFQVYTYAMKTEQGGKMHRIHMRIDEDSIPITMLADINYLENSPTKNELVYQIATSSQGEQVADMVLSYVQDKNYSANAANDQAVLSFSLTSEDIAAEFTANINTTAKYDGADVTHNTTVDAHITGVYAPIFRLSLDTVSAAPLEVALPDTAAAVRPGAMTDDELDAWASSSTVDFMTGIQNLLNALPETVLEAMGSMSY